MKTFLWLWATALCLGCVGALWLQDETVALPSVSYATGDAPSSSSIDTPRQDTVSSTPQPFVEHDSPERLPPGKITEPWTHASATSAVLYWQTENRCRSYLEYGDTDQCAHRTSLSAISAISGQPFWTHFHRLAGLRANTKYYYRLVCQGTDGSTIASPIQTFQTQTPLHAVRVPDDLPGPPYVLDRPNTVYLLTRDLTFPLGGLLIQADNVTLDMDGHTLTYNDQPADRPAQWDKRAYEQHDFGVKVAGRFHITIVNGRIEQGAGRSVGTQVGIGCNPIFSVAATNHIGGVELAWSGADISGVVLYDSEENHVHHCILDDRGDALTDRHMAIRAIGGNVSGNYDHNLVKAARQQGLANGVRVEHNEIYLRSCATNSFGITGAASTDKPVEIAFNHIFGIGQHPVGIGMFGAFAPGSTVHHNRVEVSCTQRGDEYGYAGSSCFRTTWGADHLDVGYNTFIARAARYGRDVAKARALWVGLPAFAPGKNAEKLRDARGLFHHNRIVAIGPDSAMAGAICVVCLNESPNLIFLNNDVTSTWGNVLLADTYGHADGYAKFVGNVFRRQGRSPDYYTIRQEYGGVPATAALSGNRCEDGADLSKVRLLRMGRIVLLETLDVVVVNNRKEPLGDATVEIVDQSGRCVLKNTSPCADSPAMFVSHSGPTITVEKPPRIDDRGFIEATVLKSGHLRALLPAIEITDSGPTPPQHYTLRVRKTGFHEVVEQVQLDRSQAVQIVLLDDPPKPNAPSL